MKMNDRKRMDCGIK